MFSTTVSIIGAHLNFKNKNHTQMHVHTNICTRTVSLEKRGPVVNIRGRHSSFHYFSSFPGGFLHFKNPFFGIQHLIQTEIFTFLTIIVAQKRGNNTQCVLHTLPWIPPFLHQYLVQSITGHRAHVSTHRHKHTIFNIFTVTYCPPLPATR